MSRAGATWPTSGKGHSRYRTSQAIIRILAGRAFPANEFGLSDMIGNVWEWTCDWFSTNHASNRDQGLLHPHSARMMSVSTPISPKY